jgi:hypothetical protein
MRRKVSSLFAAALIASLPSAGRASDAIRSLAERLQSADVVVDGEAGRPYTAWNGTDPATVVTYTPFAVHRVLKGHLATASILLRQPGGEVGGVGAAGDASSEFVEGERDVVLLGERDLRDGSYPITMSRGTYQVTRDANGRDSLDIHLGVDAATYPSREKGSGTPPMHVPLEFIERLARNDLSTDPSPSRTKVTPVPAAAGHAAAPQAGPRLNLRGRVVASLAGAAILALAGLVLLWRRRARR